MEVSEEQKLRMEANRAAAIARRNAKVQCRPYPEKLNSRILQPLMNMESHALSVPSASINNLSASHVAQCASILSAPENQQLLIKDCGAIDGHTGEKVKVVLEICDPDRFFLKVKSGFADRGFLESISSVARCENLEPSAMWPVYNLKDYDKVTKALKDLPDVEYEQIPWPTRMVLEKFQRAAESGVPGGSNHITDLEVEQLLLNLPLSLSKTLLPFQKEGVRYGLQRGGRCLLADEMGVGKTIQAIAMAACYREEGSLLVVCPASMRLVWAEELERWLPYLSPLDVHLVFGRKNNLTENMPLPKVVVISYTMLARLRQSMSSRKWGMIIVDEAHNLRCTRKKLECDETMAVLELAHNVKRVVLLTGTPSLSRPFDIFNQINCLWPNLLGKTKYEFARNYCDRQWQSAGQGNFMDFSRGSRLPELNVLLKQTVMIRRLKDDVMLQLPPKRRQVICLQLAPIDIQGAKAFTAATARERISAQLGEEACKCGFTRKGACDCEDENEDESNDECEAKANLTASRASARSLTEQEIGVAKLRGFQEWLLNNSIFAGRESQGESTQEKMIIFAHHMKVLDSVQTIIQSKGVEFVRIDGSTLPQDRLKNVNRFQSDPEVKLAIIGVQAGGVGLNFSAAQSVAFVELPKSASEMLQAEDRAHRRGQNNAVNIYIFVAKGTADDRRWQSLSRSLERVSTMTDGAAASLDIESVVDAAKTCLQTSRVQTDGYVLEESNGSVGIIESSDQFSEDSCMTTATTDKHIYSDNALSPILACEKQQRLCTSRFKDTTDELGHTSVDFPETSLMFEVSSNTGRIHLYLRASDECEWPTSLQSNFKPEDLAHFGEGGICERGALPTCLVNCASHREAATLFWKEYNALRPVIRKRLRGRPLSLPLSEEVKSLKDQDQYIAGGILKGGSKRRWSHREEVGCKIPEGATWRTISFQKRKGSKEIAIAQAWTAEGVPLCKYCQQPCKGHRSMKPESFADFFCQTTCLNEYSNKTSGRHVREELFDLEGGVCVKCGLDCHALVERVKPLPLELRRAYILEKAPHFNERKQLLEKLIKDPTEGNAWHADHIVAVADGGGECTMENFQTLCIACHAKVTAEQHRRRTCEKAKTRIGLQRTMKKIRERDERNKRMRTFYTEGDDAGVPQIYSSESEDDQDLLDVNVAGSAYSTSEVPTERACKSPRLELPSLEGHESPLNNLRSSPQGMGSAEVLAEHANNSLLHEATNNLRSSSQARGITEVLTEHACVPTMQPPSLEVHEPSNNVGGSPQGRGSSEVPTEHACKSIPQPQGHEPTNNLRSLPRVQDSGEVLAKHACKSILQPPVREGHETAKNVRSSAPVLSITEALTEFAWRSVLQAPRNEGHKPTNHVRSSSQVKHLQLSACNKTVSGASGTPIISEIVKIPVTKKPTFSLQSLNKYLVGPV